MDTQAKNTATDVVTMSNFFFDKLARAVDAVDDAREDFIPIKLKGNFNGILHFENMVFSVTDKMAEENDAVLWDYADLLNSNGFFIYPLTEKPFIVSNPNMQRDNYLDARTMGLVATMTVFSHASFHFEHSDKTLSQTLAAHYHTLREAFYQTVDNLVYDETSTATQAQKDEIRQLSSVVHSILD